MSTSETDTMFELELSLANFPPEVLSIIMSFLHYSDIRNARMVCKQWYAACAHNPAILNQEKVVLGDIKGVHPTDLLESSRDFYHIAFKGKYSVWTNEIFWRRLGPNLKSLSFIDTKISRQHLRKILGYCESLEAITLDKCDFISVSRSHLDQQESLPCVPKVKAINLNGILEPNLFSILVECAPNVNSLLFQSCWSQQTDSNGRLLTARVISYFENHDKQIKHLSLKHTEKHEGDMLLKLTTMPNLQLESLKADNVGRNVLQIINAQKALKTLDFCTKVDDQVMQGICESLTKLESLRLPLCQNVGAGLKYLSLLQNLTTLIVRLSDKVDDSAVWAGFCSDINFKLTSLTLIDLRSISPRCVIELARCHPNLTLLNLGGCVQGITDWSVQAIFRYQVHLQDLNLSTCNLLTDVGLKGEEVEGLSAAERRINPTGFGIARLKGLQTLSLNYCPNVKGTVFQTGVKFPNFRCLEMGFSKISVQSLDMFVNDNPTCERLDLTKNSHVGPEIKDESIHGLIAKLPHLKIVILGTCRLVSDDAVAALKNHCDVACISNK